MPIVLDCMLKNFRRGFSEDNGVKIKSQKLCAICEIGWAKF